MKKRILTKWTCQDILDIKADHETIASPAEYHPLPDFGHYDINASLMNVKDRGNINKIKAAYLPHAPVYSQGTAYNSYDGYNSDN